MNDHHRNNTTTASGKNTRTRPTIGYLTATIHDGAGAALWTGVVDAARKHDVNLIAFPGERLRDANGVKMPETILYDLVNTEDLDGLISWASSVGGYLPNEEIDRFYTRYDPVPMVSITFPLPGKPVMVADNYQGMREAMAHLIETHGYRRMAFIRGPEHHTYAQERYQAYLDVLEAYHIPVDPNLVTPPGDYVSSRGPETVALLLDERQLRPRIDVEAIVAASDLFALAALPALQARGVRVPGDIALVGFNNSPEGQCVTPPLTSVAMPFYEQGFQAVETLLAILEGRDVPAQITLPAKLVIHQSCGCLDPTVVQAAATRRALPEHSSFTAALAACRTSLLQDMSAVVERSGEGVEADWAEHVLDALTAEIAATSSGVFLSTLNEVMRQVIASGNDVLVWQNIISVLRGYAASWCADQDTLYQAETLWGQARAMIGETARRAQAYLRLQAEQQAGILRQISQALITTFDVEALMDVLAEGLPRLGIPSCYLSLYENPASPTEWARLILAYHKGERMALESDGWRFPSTRLVPEQMLSREEPYSLVMEPLYFQKEQLGFVLFEQGPQDGKIYRILRGEISSALQGALLVQRVQERSAEIARQKYVLDAFMANIPDSIYFKDRDSRITRSNQAHATSFGLTDPGDLIGKSDFDLFPKEQAQPKYDREQRIIQTGEPVLALEEPNAGGRWALTTKMPLRDEHGDIIGTFGISRDITELKKAQQALQQAYSEISVLNTQLQTDNMRMSAELNVVKQLQQMILPRPEELTNIPGLDIVGYMQPADEVGGDYYDVLRSDGVVHIGIGDVTGHGLESGVIMLMTQAAIRTLIEHGETDPIKFVTTLNRLIYKNGERIGTDKNLTFALVQYQGGQFKLVGQHEELLVVRQGGQVERVDTMNLGFPVGLEPEIRDWVHAATITLHRGEGIVLYTDGITEAENTDKQQYGLNRLCAVISAHWEQSAEAIKQAVVDDVMAHIGTQKVYDDITLVVLKQQ